MGREIQVTNCGWSAEFAIPFQSLRYGKGDLQDWGINFLRNIPRNDEKVVLGASRAAI